MGRAFIKDKREIYGKSSVQKQTMIRSLSTGNSPQFHNCELCGLSKSCRSPKISRFGEGKKGILIIGQNPDYEDDRLSVPFVGESGRLLKEKLNLLGIDLDKDCVRTNVVRCFKNPDISLTDNEIKCCQKYLLQDIEEIKPKLIICLGEVAIRAILKVKSLDAFTENQVHGKVFPYHSLNCWVGCSFHPSFFLSRKNNLRVPYDGNILAFDLANVLNCLDQSLPLPLTEEGNICVNNVQEAILVLEKYSISEIPVAFDYETNALSPYNKDIIPKIISVSLSNDIKVAHIIPFTIFSEKDLIKIFPFMVKFLASNVPKIVQNINMEESWSDVIFKQSVNNIIHDTMIAAHVINCNVRTTGLGFQAFEMTGHEYKKMVNAKKMVDVSLKDLCNYTGWDSRYTLMSYYRQIEIMKEGRLAEFYALLHRGALVLVNMYKRGVYIGLFVLDEMQQDAEMKKKQAVEEMRSLPGVQRLEQKSSCEFNPESSPQLGKVIYDEYKVEVYRKTRGGKRGSTDEKTLNIISRKCTNPDIQKLISALLIFRKFTGLLERIENYRSLVDSNSYIHPVYNLNIADSFRSSANNPSIQNVYKRDPELLFFRKCISVPN